MDYSSWDEVPEHLHTSLNFVGVAIAGNNALHFYCERFTPCAGYLILNVVVVDSSDRHNGVVLKPRLSYHPEMFFGGSYAWMVRAWLEKSMELKSGDRSAAPTE